MIAVFWKNNIDGINIEEGKADKNDICIGQTRHTL
jgi:hypothetical protein